jgi:hypothetical protein
MIHFSLATMHIKHHFAELFSKGERSGFPKATARTRGLYWMAPGSSDILPDAIERPFGNFLRSFDEAHLSAKPPETSEDTRISQADEHCGRTQGYRGQAAARSQAVGSLNRCRFAIALGSRIHLSSSGRTARARHSGASCSLCTSFRTI